MITYNTIPNIILLRAEIIDFWRCIKQQQQNSNNNNSSIWNNIYKHYILYPNPYPKTSKQLKLRWYANQSLPILLSIGGILTGRSNWLLYLKEFIYVVNFVIRNGYCYDYYEYGIDNNNNTKNYYDEPKKIIWNDDDDN